MKKHFFYFNLSVIFAFALLLYGCDCIQGEGPIVSENRSIHNFEGIELDLSADVYITKSNDYSVRIEAQQNILDIIQTRIKSGVLCIEYNNLCVNSRRGIDIYISMPEITEIYVDGSGEVVLEDRFETKKLRLDISGSGSIEMDIVAEKVDAEISGSGDLFIMGETKKLYIDISGSGGVSADKLIAEEAYVDINGSGSSRLSVENFLEADVSGSGSVYYKGNPAIRTDINGSGVVKQSK